MATHDAEYFRQRRRQEGIAPRDAFSAPRFLAYGAKLRQLEQGAQLSDKLCACGCRVEHRQRVSQTFRNPYGRGHDIVYFSSDACKGKWNRER